MDTIWSGQGNHDHPRIFREPSDGSYGSWWADVPHRCNLRIIQWNSTHHSEHGIMWTNMLGLITTGLKRQYITTRRMQEDSMSFVKEVLVFTITRKRPVNKEKSPHQLPEGGPVVLEPQTPALDRDNEPAEIFHIRVRDI